MRLPLADLSEPGRYRLTALGLLCMAIGAPIAISVAGWPDWLRLAVGAPAYIWLIVLTYRRLRDAALAEAWIGFMVIPFNVGPAWEPTDGIAIHVGNIMILLPIMLASITPTGFGANPAESTTG
ncbi:hypothetical protein [Sphingomonas sp.]|uniref:hypothetical protein n=1 Tax=Sphingomonas sp. TaxID=28214 RepID=UPI002DD671F1|nr:hypothetical protein [Sphingomonas sp.]